MPTGIENLYLPDEAMTQHVLEAATRAQQERIKQGGEAWAASQNPFGAAINGYMTGKKQRMSEEEFAANQALREIQAKRSQLGLEEEQARHDFMTKPDAKTGQTPMQREFAAHLASEELAPDVMRHSMSVEDQNLSLAQKRTAAELKAQGLEFKTAEETHDQAHLTAAIVGVQGDASLTDDQKNQKIAAIVQTFSNQSHLPPQVVQGIATSARKNAIIAENQGKAAAQTIKENQEPYRTMKPIVTSAVNNVGIVDQLDQTRNQYQTALGQGVVGRAAGADVAGTLGGLGGENATAAAARKSFADAADNIEPGLGDEVRTAGPTDVINRMSQVRNHIAGKVQRDWETNKGKIHPSMIAEPEYHQADLAVRRIAADSKPVKNKLPLTPSGQVIGTNKHFMNPVPNPGWGTAPAATQPPLPPPQPAPPPPPPQSAAPAGVAQPLPWDFQK